MTNKITIALLLIAHACTINTFAKINYTFSHDPIDVVIPCHPKDALHLDKTIDSIRKYVEDIRRIIIISPEKFSDNAEWIDEKTFPFDKEKLALEICKSQEQALRLLNMPGSRIAWIYQQFLKLFAAYHIPNISSNILIVDSDVIFLRPVSFIQENGAGLYAVRSSFRAESFFLRHISQLLPWLQRIFPEHSGITHHMLFQKPVLDDLFGMIYAHHNMEPWIAIARSIKITNQVNPNPTMSEYEIYFNFVFSRTNQVKIRKLKWQDIENTSSSHEQILNNLRGKDLDFIALHIRPR